MILWAPCNLHRHALPAGLWHLHPQPCLLSLCVALLLCQRILQSGCSALAILQTGFGRQIPSTTWSWPLSPCREGRVKQCVGHSLWPRFVLRWSRAVLKWWMEQQDGVTQPPEGHEKWPFLEDGTKWPYVVVNLCLATDWVRAPGVSNSSQNVLLLRFICEAKV